MARGVRRKPVPRKSRVCSGFTLIEILVVVAIIGLLVSILIPSLKKARDMGRRAVCLSNLHQMGLGYSNYAAENKGKMPYVGIYGYILKEPQEYHYADSTDPDRMEGANFGLLYGRYLGSDLDIFYCPSTTDEAADSPLNGRQTFFYRRADEFSRTQPVTFGGYMYAIPVAHKGQEKYDNPSQEFRNSQSPSMSGKSMFPKEVWNPYFADWIAKNMPSNWKVPFVSALQSDIVVGSSSPTESAIEGGHGNGLNCMFTDFHARFIMDPTSEGKYRNLSPTSGRGGYTKMSDMWLFMTKHP